MPPTAIFFLVWMVGTSLFLLIIAVAFLRNQIRPIQQLADAAERFGKGRDLPEDFRIRGSREVRQAGLAFLQMRDRIERQMEQRTDMLTGVSHDLRTLLTRFKLQLALIGETAGSAHDIEELQADVDEMQKMLQGYLDFAKGETGEDYQEIDICKLLRRHEKDAEFKNKKLTVPLPGRANNSWQTRRHIPPDIQSGCQWPEAWRHARNQRHTKATIGLQSVSTMTGQVYQLNYVKKSSNRLCG